MAKAKFTVQEIDQTISAMCEVTKNSFGSYSFAAGYLSMQLARAMADMPRHKQAELLQSLNETIHTYSTAVKV